MPFAKLDTARYPRTWLFDALSVVTLGPVTVGIGQANTTVAAIVPLPCAVKVVKVAVSWLTGTLANLPTFNVVYNTVQSPGSAQAYTAGNVAPMDNSYTAGVSAASGGTLTAVPTAGALTGNGTPGMPNPALTAALPNFNQQGGLGIPTNVAVDGQPLFFSDVGLNTTNFPGANATTGGQGILIPTNWDAVYPAGFYPYGVQQGMPNAANLSACFTLRGTSPVTTVTGLTVTLFIAPILLAQVQTSSATVIAPGNQTLF